LTQNLLIALVVSLRLRVRTTSTSQETSVIVIDRNRLTLLDHRS